jgi:hypothetical protein
VGPGLKSLVEGFYATGHDGTKNTRNGDTENAWMSRGVSVDGTESRNVFGNGWSVFYFWNAELSCTSAKQLSPAGHAFGRANVEFNSFSRVNLNFSYLYIISAANKYVGHIQGIDITNSTNFPTGLKPNGTPDTPPGVDVRKTYIGSELNVIARIAIFRDFQHTIGIGYFFPGDVYKTPTKSPDNAWSFLSNLRYIF